MKKVGFASALAALLATACATSGATASGATASQKPTAHAKQDREVCWIEYEAGSHFPVEMCRTGDGDPMERQRVIDQLRPKGSPQMK